MCVRVRWGPRGLVSCGGPGKGASVCVGGEGYPHRAKPGTRQLGLSRVEGLSCLSEAVKAEWGEVRLCVGAWPHVGRHGQTQ